MNKPWSWVKCNGLFFDSDYSALTAEFLIPEKEPELEKLKRDSLEFNNKEFFEIDDIYRKAVIEKIGIELTPEAKFIGGAAGFVGVIDKDIVLRRFPFIQEVIVKDKHQLYPLSELNSINPGVYRLDDLIIFANIHFRRSSSYLNTLNTEFLSELEMCPKDYNPKIALDFDLIGLFHTFKMSHEFEYWWGPKFDASLDNIKYNITRHGATNHQRFFFNLKYTDFYWHEQDGKHCFECEEILDENTTEVTSTYNMRYVHSLVDTVTKLPNHLDGAIRSYNFDEYLDRSQNKSNIKISVKANKYIKLWRIDGEIEVELWKRLICHYYRDNTLPGEYFNGEDEKINETSDSSFSSSESRSPSENSIRFLIFYSHCDKRYESDLIVVKPDKGIKNTSAVIDYLEFESFYFLKRLSILGYSVEVDSPSYEYITFNDGVVNFPSVRIVGPNSVDIAEKVLESLRIVLLQLTDKALSISFSFTVLINGIPDLHLCAGAASLIIDLLTNVPKWYTEDREDLGKQLMLIHNRIKDKCHNISLGLRSFRFERKISFPINLEGKAKLIEIDGSIATMISAVTCSNCGHNYFQCNCNDIQLYDLVYAIENSGEKMLIKPCNSKEGTR